MSGAMLLFLGLALAGGATMVLTASRVQRTAPDLDEFLGTIDHSDFELLLQKPFHQRLAHGVRTAVTSRLENRLPRQHLANVEKQLAQAGLLGKRRASDQVAAQAGLAAAGILALVLLLPSGPPPMLALALLLLPVMGWFLPSARLKKRIRRRSDAIFKDLPDIIDMLAIAVEAGSGFEAALSLVCANFDSPLAEELSIALREMELGLPRKDALQQLKERADLDVVRTFVLSLLQADALGIPIGRVLKTQATEVRARRRAWAREKAAKLPIKILFPLVLFIFPPIFALVLGPAMFSIKGL